MTNLRALAILLCLIAAQYVAVALAAPPVDSLRFSTAPRLFPDHYAVSRAFCDVMQVQDFYRTGVDPGPLSSRYVSVKANERYSTVYMPHNFSNPFVGWQIAMDNGACPADTFRVAFSTDDKMDAAAAPFRIGDVLLRYSDLPTYAHAAEWVATPGNAVILTSGQSYEAKSLIAPGVWLDPWRNSPTKVLRLSEAESAALFDRMVTSGLPELSEANFLVGLSIR